MSDARDLEPVQIDGVVRDSLCVGLAETDAYVEGEVVAVHGSGTFSALRLSKQASPRRQRCRSWRCSSHWYSPSQLRRAIRARKARPARPPVVETLPKARSRRA